MTATTMTFEQVAAWAGVDEPTMELARACTKPRIVVSGKLASGKDTVAVETMRILGFPDAVRVSVAEPLRKEVEAILDLSRKHETADAIAGISVYGRISESMAITVHAMATRALAVNPKVTSYMRTADMRSLLQYWGTDVRIAQDPSYWIRKAIYSIFHVLATDKAVYITDARFVGDIDLARSICFYALRLEVSAIVREGRLFVRDGLMLDPATENHPSEQSLENYRDFDIVVDNSGPLQQTVADIVWKLSSQPSLK